MTYDAELQERNLIEGDLGDGSVMGRKIPASQMPGSAVVLRWTVALAGLGALGLLLPANPISRLDYLAGFTIAIILSDAFLSVRVAPGSYFTVRSTFLFVYFLLAGGVAASAAEALSHFGVWAIQKARNRTVQTPLFALFTSGQYVLSSIAGAWVVTIVARNALTAAVLRKPISALLVFAAVYLVVNAALTALAVYLRAGLTETRSQLWPGPLLWMAISIGTTIPFAVVMRLIAPAIGYPIALMLIFSLLAGISLIVRLNVNLRAGNEDLRAINRVGSRLSATLDLSQLFRIIATEIRRVVPWDGFFIATGEKDSPSVQIVFMTSTGDEITQRKIARGAGMTGRAIVTGELIQYDRGEREGSVEGDDTLSGKRRPRSIVVAPMKFGDRVIGAISVQSYRSDVYGRSQTQLLQTIAAQAAIAIRNAQLFQSEQQAKEQRDEFLSIVTHEIKNPLASVRGYAELAQQSVSAGDTEAALDALGVIRNESLRILRLTEDLLDVSRLEAGKLSIVLEDVNLASVVSPIAERYSATTSYRIQMKAATPLPLVRGDATRLGQVVENLVSNAVKYNKGEGRIEISLEPEPGRVRMTVSDNGIGIPPEKLAHLFDKYYRVDESGAKIKGHGLGLYITREIVGMHGGEIRAESKLGEGSRFIVVLPIGK